MKKYRLEDSMQFLLSGECICQYGKEIVNQMPFIDTKRLLQTELNCCWLVFIACVIRRIRALVMARISHKLRPPLHDCQSNYSSTNHERLADTGTRTCPLTN